MTHLKLMHSCNSLSTLHGAFLTKVVDEKLRLGLFLRQPAYLSFSEKNLDAGVGHLRAILEMQGA